MKSKMKRITLTILLHHSLSQTQAVSAAGPWHPEVCQGPSRRHCGDVLPHHRHGLGTCFLSSAAPSNNRRASNKHRPNKLELPTAGPGIGNRYSALSVSRSVDASSARNSRTRTKKKKQGSGSDGRRRMKQSEIDSLVRGIGLEPVARTSPAKKKSNVDKEQPVGERPQPQIKDDRLDLTPSVSLQAQLDYSRKGHSVLRDFLSLSVVRQLRSGLLPHAASNEVAAWRQKVEVQLADSADEYFRENARSISDNLESIADCRDMLESLGVDPSSGDLPFLQHFNAWRAESDNSLDGVRKLCLSPYLAQTAATLMDAPTVRLYQDSLFHKRAGDGRTPWHSDARMAPFDTANMITFWIPLQEVPGPEEGGTGLLFADGSHSDFALPYWNGADGKEYSRLDERYEKVSHHMPLGVGDVTVHSGWTLHCAEAAEFLEDGEDRYAFAVSYVDGRAELRENVLSESGNANDGGNPKGDNEDVWSFRSWVSEVEPRVQFRHPLVPIVWPVEARDKV